MCLSPMFQCPMSVQSGRKIFVGLLIFHYYALFSWLFHIYIYNLQHYYHSLQSESRRSFSRNFADILTDIYQKKLFNTIWIYSNVAVCHGSMFSLPIAIARNFDKMFYLARIWNIKLAKLLDLISDPFPPFGDSLNVIEWLKDFQCNLFVFVLFFHSHFLIFFFFNFPPF